MKRLLVTILIVVAVLVAALGLAIALGGPGKAPPPMSSINDPFKNVDFSDLPEATYVTARDGTKLAFRAYPAAGGAVKGSVVLLHGSSASSSSMHLMAKGFDDLPVVRFADDERDKGLLTPQYSFALAQNFRPERDYQANIRAIRQTLRVLVGQNDDVSYADRFAAVFKTAGKDVPVTVLPGIDHISLTLDPVAVQAAIAAVESMDHEKPNQAMEPTANPP